MLRRPLFVHIVPLDGTQLEPRPPAGGGPARPDSGLIHAELEDPHAGRSHVQPLRRPIQLVPVLYRLFLEANFLYSDHLGRQTLGQTSPFKIRFQHFVTLPFFKISY